MKKEKGLTLIALIIIVVVVGMIIFAGWRYIQEYMTKQKNEDIKAEMLAIQTIITNIKNKNEVDAEKNFLIGTKLELENNTTIYNISEELKQSMQKQENSDLYILNNEELKNNGLNNIDVNEMEFYVVDYNSGEIFYSLGINGKYKLSEI